MFGLTSQLKRSGVSIPSNIAEGHRRGSDKEFMQFLNIARGSLAEVETQIIIATDIKLIDDSVSAEMLTEINEVGKMINGLMSALAK